MMPAAHGPLMPDRAEPVDTALLAELLGALSYPARLDLLGILRQPHTLGDIKLRPRQVRSGNPERAAARPTVLAHLDKLEEAGLVRSEPIERDGRQVPCYFVNPLRLYEMTEELRRLTVQNAGRGLPADATGTLGGATATPQVLGPRLVLVHGIYEGRAYPLRDTAAKGGAWTIGRRRDLAVGLDYDPFVSVEHAEVRREGARFVLHDLPRSKNGTAVNWNLLPKGGAHTLKPGDVVGVGRSLLVFVPD
jgi:DNA-binding transcriptional ArsR family regulator